MKVPTRLVLAVAAITAIAPAFAQEAIGTLQVQGTVMTSTGGEFASATSGQAIQAGERIMVGEGGNASVTFSNGAVVNYAVPGVYTVQLPAVATAATGTAVGTAGGASAAATVGVIVGAAALGAAATDQMGDEVPPDQPVSR